MRARRFVTALLAAWLLACAIMLVVGWQSIQHAVYPDPDDVLRLQEVRDFVGGQSWFDVTQYRMNPPGGAPMHWSRLVDLPIAAVILLARPLLGAAQAEMVAAVIVPLLTLGVVMLLVALIVRRLIGAEAGLLAALLVPTAPTVLMQIRPLRVDHHGWQIALALAAVLATFDDRPRRSGLAGGLLLALWLQISLEGLPFSVAVAGLFAARWLFDPAAETERFRCFILAFAGASLLLFAATHELPAWQAVHCDAISPAQLAVFAVAAIGCVLATLPLAARRFASRIAALGLAAIAAAAVYRLAAPRCGLDAFGELDPLVRTLWYDHVLEGLPLWRQAPDLIVSGIGFPLIAMAGSWFGWRNATPETRPLWINYGALLVAAAIVTLLVQRAGAVANALSVVGATALLMPLLVRAQSASSALVRVFGSVLALLALAPPTLALAYVGVFGAVARPQDKAPRGEGCSTMEHIRLLNSLPPSALLTDIDIAPGVLHETPHSVVASGHHRNQAGIRDVLQTFTGGDEEAHAILLRHRIDYIVVCPDLAEMDVYARYAPDGLWSHLRAGRTPAWLEPVRIAGDSKFAIWKLRR
ncbi:hypothetical protein [Flavisphingomonas formosensis]|uniref:hypothetical protein n=1 Tax=Flavisphingomonas formosensis TaxID=861534 RepID=UPI0012FB4D88|nr:hypothetical protein [Sphingomonas formosensis]